jgi:copper(I)-binding protein
MPNLRCVRLVAFAFAAVFAMTATALSHEYVSGQIKVVHPWARATAPGATTGVGYMKIINQGATPIRLLGGSTPAATAVEIHAMSMDGGVMRMRPVGEGLVVPARGQIELKPGSIHLMLIGLKHPLVEEDLEPLTLNFDGGVRVNIELYIESMGAASGGHGH